MVMTEGMACPICGGELLPHIVCPFCGADITLKSFEGLEPMYKCPVCGNDAPVKFICNDCGSEFKYDLIMEKMSEAPAIARESKAEPKKEKAPSGKGIAELSTGLTNGLNHRKKGLTNGTAVDKKRGKGLTNGLSKEKKKGLTNGLGGGLTNGVGVTNGTKPLKKPVRAKKKEGSKLAAAVTVAVVLILIFAAFYFMVSFPKGGMQIDGNFSDWKGIPLKGEAQPAQHPLDMVQYASKLTDSGLFMYLETQSAHIFDTEGSRIYAFIDSDNNPSTGYRINGIGADYLCKIYGEGGKIDAKGSYQYAAQGDDYGFAWSWQSYDGLSVAYSDNRLEMAFSPLNIHKDYRIAFYTSTKGGSSEISSMNIGDSPSVYVEKSSLAQPVYTSQFGRSVALMKLDITGTGGETALTSISVEYTGVSSISLRDTQGNVIATATGNTISVNRALPANQGITYEIYGRLPANRPVNGTPISLNVTGISFSPSAIVHMVGYPVKAYLGQPPHIMIDGAFGDWLSVKTDPYDAQLPSSIDIRAYDAVKNETTHDAYFYLRVRGKMMGGAVVPEKYAEGVPGTVTGIPKTPTGEDIARAFINTDNGRYKLEILGKNGQIVSKTLYIYGNGWQPLAGDIEVGKDSGQMEFSVPLNAIGSKNMTVSFQTSDWEQNTDTAGPLDVEQSTRDYTRAYADALSPVPEFPTAVIPLLFTVFIALFVIRRKHE